jgi:preprotein translocase subunit SecD
MTTRTDSRDLETRLIAALSDTARRNLPDATAVTPFRPASSASRSAGPIRSWAVPVLAAAIVVTLAVSALVLTGRDRRSSAPPASKVPETLITLRSRTAGLSTAELERARQIINARAAALGAANADVRIVGPDEITASLPGVAASAVGDLGAADVLGVRPLIVPPVPLASRSPGPVAPSHAPRPVDQWTALGFAPPKDAAAYNALGTSRRSAVQAVINDWDCTNLPLDRAGAPIVACDRDGTDKYLLGPVILSGNDVRSARVGALAGSVGWQVFVSLTAFGQQRWSGYTAQHNESAQPGAIANQVATTLDGAVIIASTVQETITGDTSIASGLDQRAATALAANLTSGSLPAAFDLVAIQSR